MYRYVGNISDLSHYIVKLTNDGDIYNKIIHPRVEVEKKYIALCKGVFSDEEIKKFENGIDIGGYITANAKIKLIDKEKDKKTNAVNSLVEIIIHEGKNRQIRKMCSALGHEVITLKRVAVGDIKLGYLKRGEWRNLNEDELNYINSL